MAKLTIDIDAGIIEGVKLYAKHRGVNVSQLVELYLTSLVPVAPGLAPVLRSVKGKKQHEDLEGYRKHMAPKRA